MKKCFLIHLIILPWSIFAQRSVYFKENKFDSASMVLLLPAPPSDTNALIYDRFLFLLDNTEDLNKLKQDWIFKKKLPSFDIVKDLQDVDKYTLQVVVLKDHEIVRNKDQGFINPGDGKIKTPEGWYSFDTMLLKNLHAEHPLKYYMEKVHFDVYSDFIFYQDSIKMVPGFLFLFGPTLQYEGKFSLIINKSNEKEMPFTAIKDLETELERNYPKSRYNVLFPYNDNFNESNKDKLKVLIECSKNFFDNFKTQNGEKGEWEPSTIEAKVFWRKKD